MELQELEPEYSPINKSVLRGFIRENEESSTTVSMEYRIADVSTPIPGSSSNTYEIEIEYEAGEFYLNDSSMEFYLDSYSDASITQEHMAEKIQRHLSEALDSTHVFVDITRDSMRNCDKRIWTGRA